jgi:hypothetical protein
LQVLGGGDGAADALPASYHYYEGAGRRNRRIVGNTVDDATRLIETELSFEDLGEMLPHL